MSSIKYDLFRAFIFIVYMTKIICDAVKIFLVSFEFFIYYNSIKWVEVIQIFRIKCTDNYTKNEIFASLVRRFKIPIRQ
jgi:hypothetical protein